MLDWLTLPRLRLPRPKLAMDYDDAEERLGKTSAKRGNNEPGGSFRKWNTIDVCWLFILVICMIYAMITAAVHNFSRCPEFCRSEEYCRDSGAQMWIGGSATSANASWYRCACSGTAACKTTESATSSSNGAHDGMKKREHEISEASAVSIPSAGGDLIVSAARESPMHSAGTSPVGITGELTTFITTAKPRWTNSTSADATSSGVVLPVGTVSIGPKLFPNATGVPVSGVGLLNSSFAPVEKSYKHACDFKRKYTCGPSNVQGAGTGDVIRQVGDVSDGVCTCYCTPLDGVKDAIFDTAFDKACDYFSTAWIGTDFSQVLFHNYDYGYVSRNWKSPIFSKVEYWGKNESMQDNCPPTKIDKAACVKALTSVMTQCDRKNHRVGGVAMDSCFKWTVDPYSWVNNGNMYSLIEKGYCPYNPGDPANDMDHFSYCRNKARIDD